jgi:hypothetical protein
LSSALIDTFSEASDTFDTSQTVGAKQTKLLVEISRHGARTSSKIYPFTVDPNENFTEKSQLTSLGASQHFNMGSYIKSKFIDQESFLSQSYDASSD